MSNIRTRDHYMTRYQEQEAAVTDVKAQMDKAIECAEFSMAAMLCDELKTALTSLNTTANILADMDG